MQPAELIFAALAAFPAFAQYTGPYDLATSQDGSVQYFSAVVSSFDTQHNTWTSDTKIFRWSKEKGVTIFGERPDLAFFPMGAHLYGTELTYEGTVPYHAEPTCLVFSSVAGNHCPVGETQVVIPNVPPLNTYAGAVRRHSAPR